MPTLLRQGGEAGSFEFTATLFDLIRRGVFTSTPVTTERATWGGLRTENVSDLELAAGNRDATLTPWENAVAAVVDGVIEDGAERLSRFRERIEADRDDDEHALHLVQGERRTPRSATGSGSSRAARCRSPWRCLRSARSERCSSSSPPTAGARCTRGGTTSC